MRKKTERGGRKMMKKEKIKVGRKEEGKCTFRSKQKGETNRRGSCEGNYDRNIKNISL